MRLHRAKRAREAMTCPFDSAQRPLRRVVRSPEGGIVDDLLQNTLRIELFRPSLTTKCAKCSCR